MMTIFTEDVPTALFTCFKTCAEKAIEESKFFIKNRVIKLIKYFYKIR